MCICKLLLVSSWVVSCRTMCYVWDTSSIKWFYAMVNLHTSLLVFLISLLSFLYFGDKLHKNSSPWPNFFYHDCGSSFSKQNDINKMRASRSLICWQQIAHATLFLFLFEYGCVRCVHATYFNRGEIVIQILHRFSLKTMSLLINCSGWHNIIWYNLIVAGKE